MIIEIKCTVNVMWSNHPETILLVRSMEKLSSTKLVHAAKNVGRRCTHQSLPHMLS